jgi:hypothetical protein
VAEYALNGYPITDDDILSTGRDAWDAALNTVNVGKFNLGWGAIGIAPMPFTRPSTTPATGTSTANGSRIFRTSSSFSWMPMPVWPP